MLPVPSFITANYVARQLGYRMEKGWGQGDQATHEWFKPSLKWARRQGSAMFQHVEMGGLVIRDVVADPEPHA